MTESSTTPPYSNASSSSTPPAPQNYFQPQVGSSNGGNGNGVDWNQWAILIVSMLLTGVIGYFSSLMAVKDDISKNREGISVSEEKIKNITSDVGDLKASIKSIDYLHKNVGILEVKVESISKELEKQSGQIESNKQVITSKGSGR